MISSLFLFDLNQLHFALNVQHLQTRNTFLNLHLCSGGRLHEAAGSKRQQVLPEPLGWGGAGGPDGRWRVPGAPLLQRPTVGVHPTHAHGLQQGLLFAFRAYSTVPLQSPTFLTWLDVPVRKEACFCLFVCLSVSQSALLLSLSDSAIHFRLRQRADKTEMETQAILSQTHKQIIEIVPLKWAAIELSQRVLQESRVCAWDIEISEQNSHSFCVFPSHLLLALSFSASSTRSFSVVILW